MTRSVRSDSPVPLDSLACRAVVAGLLVLVLTSATMPPATAASASNPTAGAPATIKTAAARKIDQIVTLDEDLRRRVDAA